MPAPNNTTAQSQIALMLQTVQEDIETTQNLDQGVDRLFQQASGSDMGTEKYRHPIQYDVGGQMGAYFPDGGAYFQGTGPGYNQLILVPFCLMIAYAATELLQRIQKAGDKLAILSPVSRMVSTAKTKAAHCRNALAQGYNQGLLATVDASFAGGSTVVPMANVPFGARLLDINNQYQATDANFNVLGVVTVLDKSTSLGGGLDTATFDNIPQGFGPGCNLIPINLASGAPLGPQGLQYIVSPSPNGDYCSIDRNTSYVQAPAFNAQTGTLTLGVIEGMTVRQSLNLGTDSSNNGARVYYTNEMHRTSARMLGFAKTVFSSPNGKAMDVDIAPARDGRWVIGGQEVVVDSMAAVDKLYDLDKSTLRKVRYPGSQKFLEGPLMGLWWPRLVNGQWTSESDLLYQDSYNFYSKLPWKNAVAHNLGINPLFASAA